jgi:hypothetical protein
LNKTLHVQIQYFWTLLTDSRHVTCTSLSRHLSLRKLLERHVNTADVANFHVLTDYESTVYLPEPNLHITATRFAIWNTKRVQHARETSLICVIHDLCSSGINASATE